METTQTTETTQPTQPASYREGTIKNWRMLVISLKPIEWSIAQTILSKQIKPYKEICANATSCDEVLAALDTLQVSSRAGGKKNVSIQLFEFTNPTMAQLLENQKNWSKVDANVLRRALNLAFTNVMADFTSATGEPRNRKRATGEAPAK